MRNDDMSGLEFFGDDLAAGMPDMDDYFSQEAVVDSATGIGAGAAGVLLTSWVLPMIPLPDDWEDGTKRTVRSIAGILLAFFGGRTLARVWNSQAGSGFEGAVGGLALANLVASLTGTDLTLGDAADDELSGPEDEMLGVDSSMAALQSAVTETDRRQLAAAVTQSETLQMAEAYNPYMS
jgi:hypothetical protein